MPGHHGPDCRARLGPVKALAPLDPHARAGGLDRALGRAQSCIYVMAGELWLGEAMEAIISADAPDPISIDLDAR